MTVSSTWEDNDGCLPALDAGGCRFESCFPDKMPCGVMVIPKSLDLELWVRRYQGNKCGDGGIGIRA